MLTRAALPFRNLRYFGAANSLIVLGVMLGAAVLTGALLLGDSLKGSLANLTLDRLGQIDAALLAERFFPATLATRLSPANDITPAILLHGTVLRRDADGSKVLGRAGQVQVVGIEPAFWKLFGESRDDLSRDAVLINRALADALQVQPHDGLEVRIEKPQRVPAESVLGKRTDDPALVIETSKLAGILPDHGAGRFTLLPRQETPLILYVQLDRLQRRLTRDQQQPAGSVNVLLARHAENQIEKLQAALDRVATLEDLGFTLRKNADNTALVLETDRMLLDPAAVQAVEGKLRGENQYTLTPVITYLANRIYRIDQTAANGQPNGLFVPYSAIAGLARVNDVALGEDDVVIDDFVAQDLWPTRDWQAALGKSIVRIEYFVESEGHRLREETHDLKLKAVVPLQGVAADRTLTPEFPGMRTSRIADWNPPFPRDQWHPEWIRPRDELYYRQHRATPKLFLHPKTAEKLFSSRFGSFTSLRISPARGALTPRAEQVLRERLTAALRPADFGLTWQPVKAQGLRAATQGGTTNMFGGLFAGFSLFLILSAALLVGLLFRLRVERRAREIGLLLATGWPVAKTRKLLMTEGFILALAGTVLGLPAALGYAWLMIQSLRSGWGGLLASDSLSLHVGPISLAAGALASILIALVAIYWSLRGLVRQPVSVLLAGRAAPPLLPQTHQSWATWSPVVTALLTLGLIGYGSTLPAAQKPGPFFGAGFLSLLTLLLVARLLLRRRAEHGQSLVLHPTLGQLGRINIARSPGRSLLTMTLLAAGCFLVVAVGAFRKASVNVNDPSSGAGGFSLVAESDVPLRTVPHSTADWEALLGELTPEQRNQLQLLAGLNWFGFRLRSGEDVSCLNLYQPTRPRVLGVARRFGQQNRFTIQLWDQATPAQKSSPWNALFESPSNSQAIPVFLDDHTAQWVLQKKLGDSVDLVDEAGARHDGIFVGMLQGSIFQSEVLIAEDHFRRLFPGEAGYRYFLVQTGDARVLRPVLEALLGESDGLVVRTTVERLATFHAVENTYIGTFQALGGLGLLLGTAGLAIVLLRNVQERRSELALLQAVGFNRRQVAATLLFEVAWLVAVGVGIGCTSALIVIAPLMTGETIRQLLTWFLLILVLVPIMGWLSSLAGLRLALRTPLIPALRGE